MSVLRKFYCILMVFLLSSSALAQFSFTPLVNKITLPLTAEAWVTTKTALVNVRVNAAVSDHGVENVQSGVMGKLNQLSNQGVWHIVSLDRQQDKSGLENIQIIASARLPQVELSNLRNKAKNLSKPGETYVIDSVLFTPSEDEIKDALTLLRSNLYQQAKAEIEALNKIYPDQKYYLHQIDFLAPPVMPMPEMALMTRTVSAAATSQPLSIGNKVSLQATVVIASIPDQILQKITP